MHVDNCSLRTKYYHSLHKSY